MREAFEPEVEEMFANYCIQVLNAQSEEELEILKEEIIVSLKECGLNETSIQNFLTSADRMVEYYSKEDNMMQNDIYAETNTEIGTPSSILSANQNNDVIPGVLIGGLGLTALMSVLALKQKIFNKNKENEDNKTL